jgi:glucuronate isomerase
MKSLEKSFINRALILEINFAEKEIKQNRNTTQSVVNSKRNMKEQLIKILGEDAYSIGNMQVSENVKKLVKALYYLDGQLPMIGRDLDKEGKEYIQDVLTTTKEILS